jgi:hypothetical protein
MFFFSSKSGGTRPGCTRGYRHSANSAASERVFSIMKRMYGKHSGRDNSLGEQVSTSIKLAYNHRVR